MKTLKQIDGTNDILLSDSGDIAVSTGIDAYATVLSDAVRTVLGEIQLDITIGIDYFGTVFNSVNGIGEWKLAVRRTLESYDFVKSVDDMQVSIDTSNRTVAYTVNVTTDIGDVVLQN